MTLQPRWSHLLVLLPLISAGPATAEEPRIVGGPDWVQVAKQAAWTPRDSQAEYVHDGQLWLIGGWVSGKEPNLLDVWKSADGVRWHRVLETGPWVQTDLSVSVVFDDKLWLMGGRKLPGTECSNKVWSSSDGAEWTLVAEAGWSPRLAPGFAVFQDRMWVLGGTSDNYHNNDDTMFNDVWSSADGKEWRLETADAGWSKRANGNALAFDGKLWVMGGGPRNPKPVPTNDVWCSDDGVHWRQVTAAAGWKPRMWLSTVVYRDCMWVIGGWSEEQGNFRDVWFSRDGEKWTELKSQTIWSERHEQSAWVFQDKLWIAGGATGRDYKLDSEVWTLQLPTDWTGQ